MGRSANLSLHGVVEQMTTDLAEQRHSRLERQAAYIALARAILAEDVRETEQLSESDGRAA
jgi:hypothetical protein